MRNRFLIISCIVFTSCSILYPEGVSFNFPDYNFNYHVFNKRLDYNDKIYLLNPTEIEGSKFDLGTNLAHVVLYFKDKLGDNVFQNKDFKDAKDRLMIPYNFNYDITDKEIDFLKATTDLDYVILSKIIYLNQMKKTNFNTPTKSSFNNSDSGAMSFIKILDIKNNNVLIEMSCSGEVTTPEERDFNTGQLKLQKKSIHKNSSSLGEKTMKKLLKKIK